MQPHAHMLMASLKGRPSISSGALERDSGEDNDDKRLVN